MDLPTLHGERVTLRPLREDDLDALAEFVRAPGTREWWGTMVDDTERLREDLRTEGRAFAIEVDGELAGWLGFDEEREHDYPSVGFDIALSPRHQDQGLGPEAIRTAIDWFVAERGHHRFTIDPSAGNERAIRAYASVGFKPVGVMRQYERAPDGSWRDSLYMDLVADELPPGTGRPAGA